MAGQLTVMIVGMDFPLSGNIALAVTFREQTQVTAVRNRQFPQTRPITFVSDFFSLSDQLSLKVKSGADTVAAADTSFQTFFEPNSKQTERWLDVYSVAASPDRKKRFLPLGGAGDKARRLGKVRVKLVLEVQGELASPGEMHMPISSIPKAESPPKRPPSRDLSPKRPASVRNAKPSTPSKARPASGAFSPQRPPSRSESVKDLSHEADLSSFPPNRSMDLGDDSFKIDLQMAMENQTQSPYLYEEPEEDASDCPRCVKLKQLAVAQEGQINHMQEMLWREHSSLLSAAGGETSPVLTRFSMGRNDPSTMVAVPLPGAGLSRVESEVYQKVLHALNSQLKILQLAEHEEELLKEKIQQSANSRAELQTSLKETQQQMEKLEQRNKAVMAEIAADKAEIVRETEAIGKNLKRKGEDTYELSEELAQLQAEEEGKRREAADYERLRQEVARMYEGMTKELDLRGKLEQEYASLEKDQSRVLSTHFQSMSQAYSKNQDLHSQVSELRAQLSQEQARQERLRSEGQTLRNHFSTLSADSILVQNDKQTHAGLRSRDRTVKEVIASTNRSLFTTKETYEAAIASIRQLSDTLRSRKDQTADLLSEVRNVLALRQEEAADLSSQVQGRRTQLALLESCREDIVPAGKPDSRAFRDTLLGEVVLEANVMIVETLKAASASGLVIKLKAGVEALAKTAKESMAAAYKAYLSKGVYTPDPSDALDIEVAKAVNAARTDALVPMFRLSPGRYLFGTAHITISVVSGAPHVHSSSQVLPLPRYLSQCGPVEQQKVAVALEL